MLTVLNNPKRATWSISHHTHFTTTEGDIITAKHFSAECPLPHCLAVPYQAPRGAHKVEPRAIGGNPAVTGGTGRAVHVLQQETAALLHYWASLGHSQAADGDCLGEGTLQHQHLLVHQCSWWGPEEGSVLMAVISQEAPKNNA